VGTVIMPDGAKVKPTREAFTKELRNGPPPWLEDESATERVNRVLIDLIEAASGITRSFQLMLGALRCAEARLPSASDEGNKAPEAITPDMLLVTSDDALKDLIGRFGTCLRHVGQAIKKLPHPDMTEVTVNLLLAMVGPLAELRVHAGPRHWQPIAEALTALIPGDLKTESASEQQLTLGGHKLSGADKESLRRLLVCLQTLFKSYYETKPTGRGASKPPDPALGRAALTLQSLLQMPASAIEIALERQ
jgi:hypothetical protein